MGDESGRGRPHSKTLSRFQGRRYFRQAVECGCPLALLMAMFKPPGLIAKCELQIHPHPVLLNPVGRQH